MTSLTPLETLRKYEEALNRGDLEATILNYDESAVLYGLGAAPIVGRTAIREKLARFIAAKGALFMSDQKVIVADGLALHKSFWTSSSTRRDGSSISGSGISWDVLRRHDDGRWLIVVDNPRPGTAGEPS